MALRQTRSGRSASASLVRTRLRTRVRTAMLPSLVFAAIMCAAALTMTLLCLGSSPASAVPADNSQIRLYGEVKAQVDSLSNQAAFVQAEIDSLDSELELSTESYNQLSVKLDEINVQMTDLRKQLKQAEADHAAQIKKLESRICAIYKAGGRDQLLQMLLLADGVQDLYNRIRIVSTLADQDQRLVTDLKESAKKLDELLAEIDENKRAELTVRRQLDDQRAQIEEKLAERQDVLVDIDNQINTIIQQERQRQQAEQERLRQAIQSLINGGQHYIGPLPQTDDQILNQFIQTAVYYLGIPYVWAGDRPSSGFDCSGFTRYVYGQHGVDLPHYSGYQAQMGIPVDLVDIQPGDLLAFGFPVHHVGIYLGNDLFIHAPRTGDVIKISHLSERTNLSAVRRFYLQPRIGQPTVG